MLHVTGQYKTWTADYGLGIKHGLGYKMWTKHYGLGIKYGLRCKTRINYKFCINSREPTPIQFVCGGLFVEMGSVDIFTLGIQERTSTLHLLFCYPILLFQCEV